jgi:hypothetical protein
MIDQLPSLLPDPSRASRTRARCHKKLSSLARPREQRRFAAERGLFLAFGAVYLSSIAVDLLPVLIR